MDDDALVRATLEGDERAFEILVGRHQRQVYRTAMAILKDESEADIVTQDTFVQAFTHLSKFEGRSLLETWLTRIAINRARDVLRRRRGLRLLSLGASDDDEQILEIADERPDPERQLLSAEIGSAIERAEQSLSTRQKLIFRLRHHAGLPLEEIASQLGMRATTVRVHLFRAIKKIRKELGGWQQQPVTTETADVSAFQ
ncbi:MAG: sigma-70 family RNA polymerase sigma factor [Thermoanaerobaculia bacterium]